MVRAIASALVLGLFTSLAAAGEVKSGPQVDQRVPGPFHPLNVNGDNAGKKHCLFCENGEKPVAMIFAREVTPALTKLIAKIDAATAKSEGKLGSFVVVLSDKDGIEKDLKKVANEQKLKNCILSIDNPAGPKGYEVAKDADVTVVLYQDFKVKNNYAFKKGELKEKDVDTITTAFTGLNK